MTANLNIEVARRSNVLRVPNAATRFRPTRDTFAALNQAITPDIERALGGGRGGFNGRGRGDAGMGTGARQNGAAGTSAANRPQGQGTGLPAAGQGGAAFQRGGGDQPGTGRGNFANMTPEERQKRMQERLAQMSPEERQQFEARMRDRMAQGGGRGTGASGTGPRGAAPAQAATATGAQTIDSLFGPLPVTESRGRVWLYIDKQLKPVSLRLGISDGTWTEVLDGNELQPGQEVVTNVTTGAEPAQRPGNQSPAGNPLMGPQRGGFRGRG
jgi:HlyD family secretion protein